jgi:hypothetical protein
MKDEAADSEADAASTTGLNTWQIDPMSSDFLGEVGRQLAWGGGEAARWEDS